MPRLSITSLRLTAVTLSVTSVLASPYLGTLLFALTLYYGTPGQSSQFYAVGCLVLLVIAVTLLTIWAITAYTLYCAFISKQHS
jgi:hypothetical protein